MFTLLKKIFGTQQTRLIKKYRQIVKEINAIELTYQKLSEEEVVNKTAEFTQRYQEGESLDALLPEAFATVKNICRRLIGTDIHVSGYDQKWDMIPYDVQIIGAIAMYYGSIAEMQTGEGKTLTASMPLYLNAITKKGVHLVTVNDYLAKRDSQWIGTIFKKLKLSINHLTHDVEMHQRKDVYNSDIVYGTASEFGFDYLRDNSMATSKEEQVQRKAYFAIIDEVDSILIDESRTPLIISGPSDVSFQMYDDLKYGVASVVKMQTELCNKMATEARKTLDNLKILNEEEKISLSKDETILFKNTFKTLWLVSKGTPNNKILKRIKENPFLRKELDDLETYFHLDPNKKEKAEEISKLYIVIDERNSEYELTDKGIETFSKLEGNTTNDFVMLDLGYEYGKIDSGNLSEKEKMDKKIALREEDSKRKEKAHNLRQLFRAHLLMEKDVDYIISNNEIIIIDENTGRAQPGRRFSDGLHQAIEAKENVKVQKETQTYATITLQNYFRMYEKLAGMSGTAITEAFEFKQIYKLDVLEIPTYTPCKRKDFDDEIYMTEREKYHAIVKEINKQYEIKRPILIGTESVEISEKLSRILKQNKIPHNILNAKNHEREAEIIANAGQIGSITISTNMAGRGTDIKISKEVKDVGGLYVLGTTRHQSRRIDRQLRGRSGRLGDVGSSKFYVSFEDSLMRLFASPRLTSMLQRFRPPEGEPISAKVLNKSIETAQKRIEQRNFQMRKHTLEYDDVMNLQRQEIYSFRNEAIQSDSSIELAKDILATVIIDEISKYSDISSFNSKEFSFNLMLLFPVTIDYKIFEKENITFNEIEKIAIDKVLNTFDEKLNIQKSLILEINDNNSDEDIIKVLNEVIRSIIIRKIDKNWQEHLLKIDHLRSDVSIRAYGQKDPLMEFKHEAFSLFDNLNSNLKLYISKDLFRFEMVSQKDRKLNETIKELQTTTQKSFVPQPNQMNENINKENIEKTITVLPKVGRNDNCPCGSGKKHKKCCGLTHSHD